jgi:hypothetical protein
MIILSVFFLCKYSFSGKESFSFNAPRGHAVTHFAHLMHLLLVIPDLIAPRGHFSAQTLQPLQSESLRIFSPSLLLSFGKMFAKGFL